MKPKRDGQQLELFRIEWYLTAQHSPLAKILTAEQFDAWVEGYALGDPVARKLYRLWIDRGMETYYL